MLMTRSLYALMAAIVLALLQSNAYAQEDTAPSIAIVTVDTQQAPTTHVVIVGEHLAAPIGELPLNLLENGVEQEIVRDQTEDVGYQLAILIDPHNLDEPGASGQARQSELTGAILDLVEKDAFVRNVDRLIAYSGSTGGDLEMIQDWTEEPNLIFNSVVQNQPVTIDGSGVSPDTIMAMLNLFEAPDSPYAGPQAIILFSAGSPNLNNNQLVEHARVRNIPIHTVELPNPDQPEISDSDLKALAANTGGLYIPLTSADSLAPLFNRLAEARVHRTLTYESASTAAKTVEAQVTLPDGQAIGDALELAGSTEVAAEPEAATSVASVSAAPVAQSTTTAGLNEGAGSQAALSGLQTSAPNVAVQAALVIGALALAVLVIISVRSRRRRGSRKSSTDVADDLSVDAYSEQIDDPLYRLEPTGRKASERGATDPATDDELQVLAADQRMPAGRPAAAASGAADGQRVDFDQIAYDSVDYDDEVTMSPLSAIGDDELTYRLSVEVEQPIIGNLVRVTSDPRLPKELPIYGLSPDEIEGRQIHIGRHSKQNTVVINDKSVSRVHAAIVQKEGRLFLRDNASTSGTYLNWRRLNPGEELLLRHNDLISFGEIVYEFRAEGEDEATVADE